VPDQVTGSRSLRLREPTLHVHAIPWCVREENETTRPMDDGCGAGVGIPSYLCTQATMTMTPTLWGMAGFMQLATAAQRRKNLDTIHGAKREECRQGFS
jgi:hypothetical protein